MQQRQGEDGERKWRGPRRGRGGGQDRARRVGSVNNCRGPQRGHDGCVSWRHNQNASPKNTKASRWQYNTKAAILVGISTRREPEKYIMNIHYCLYTSLIIGKKNRLYKYVCNILASAGFSCKQWRRIHHRLRCVGSDCKHGTWWFCSA